ncbi:dockerin type I domain-containing protein [Fimbriimonas ginsengisoli]|nr:dockerin type I domain-containing protein [Fimbriimonas ginsengisoli]
MKTRLPLQFFRRAIALAGGVMFAAAASAAATPWTQWKVSDGGNGHWYRAVDNGSEISWTSARAAAIQDGVHLATITSQGENNFVYNLSSDDAYWHTDSNETIDIGPWLGALQSPAGFSWVTGEAFSFTAWLPGEPNGDPDSAIHFMGQGLVRGANWNDATKAVTPTLSPSSYIEELDSVATAPAPFTSGLPVDLNGSYLAALNRVVGATTDRDGIGASGMVQEPSSIWCFTPFSNWSKTPTVRDYLNLRGTSYGFDVDLGDPARWPNPSSLTDWFAGNAADGHEGSTLVVRAASSAGVAPIDLSNMNGLRVMFYRKDGKFFGHIANLWYSQEIALPGASVANRYRVQVNVNGTGGVQVFFIQLNGPGTNSYVTQTLVGGSESLSSASFAVQMANVTRTSQTPATPTQAAVYGFWTSASTGTLYAFTANPYLGTKDRPATAVFGLYNSYLPFKAMGYHASLQLYQAGTALSFLEGQYENTALFEAAGAPVFAPNVTGRFDHSQFTGIVAKATQQPLLLESYNFVAPQGSYNPGGSRLGVLWQYAGGPLWTSFNSAAGVYFARTLDSNGVVVDPLAPAMGPVGVQQLTGTDYTAKSMQIVVGANDTGSGLADAPLLNVTLTSNHGLVTTRTIRMGSLNPVNGIFGAVLTLPLGTMTMSLSANVSDRAGNAATPSTRTVSIQIPPPSTLSLPIQLTGFSAPGPVNRLVRIVLGRKGGDGIVGTRDRIVINRVVTFSGTGAGTATLTVADGLPEFATGGISQVWVKDPFHTVGKSAPLKLTGSVYSLNGVASVVLTPGDVTNNNVTDSADYTIFTTSAFGAVPATTWFLPDTAALVPANLRNLDLNGDGRFDARDVALMNLYFGKVGDPEPSNYNP